MTQERSTPSDIHGISQRLMVTRLALNLKKSEFADKAEISRTAYHNWEPKEGQPPVGRPNVDEAYKLVKAYDLTLDWIYRGIRSRLPHELVEAIEAVERDLQLGKYSSETKPAKIAKAKRRA